jgi:pyruvate ferredoxin oxidoreductase gamma subunit
VLASIALAKAFFKSGYWVQTFPVFGSERRGAPVEAYLRLDRAKILARCNVYEPDHVVVQDMRLLETVDVRRGLKAGGWLLLNTPLSPEEMAAKDGFGAFRIATIDASRIAREHGLGSQSQPITNTAMMGAFARIMGAPNLHDLLESIIEEMPAKKAENASAAEIAYSQARVAPGPAEGGRA